MSGFLNNFNDLLKIAKGENFQKFLVNPNPTSAVVKR
jgi:hypothetical protein